MRPEQPSTIYLKDYRPSDYLIETAHFDIALDPTRTRVASRLSVVPNPAAKKKGGVLRLNGETLALERVAVDGVELTSRDYVLDGASLTIKRPPAAAFTLEITSTCDPEANKALSGLYRSGGMYCTQCEAEGFRRITYYLDRPDVLAKYRVRIEADKHQAPVLLSNGNLVRSGDLGGGRHFAVWEDPFPKPSYLFALVAGNLAHISDHFKTASGRKIELRIYCEPGKEERCHWAMECLKRSMRWDEKRFGLEYDLDIFMIVAVSAFNMGAMENKGLNIFNDKLILVRPDTATDGDYEGVESVVAHEYFHNWTGNRVTCRDWFQLCLKEGLTVFRDHEFSADERSAAVNRIWNVRGLKAGQFREDSGPLAHPVRPASFIEISNFYTSTVYQKGGELCGMLQTILGVKGFRKGMDLYFKRHDGSAVTVEDFVGAMADANGVDLQQFMLWYNQAGTPELNVRYSYSAKDKTAKVTMTQTLPLTPGQDKKKPQPIPVKFALVDKNGKDLPLKLAGGGTVTDGLLHLRKKKETFVFEGLDERPVPSILRDFSAPVRLYTNLTDNDQLFIAARDSNLFNRAQAMQNLALQLFVRAVEDVQAGKTPRVPPKFLEALKNTLANGKLDPAYRAAFIVVPGEAEIANCIRVNVDPEAVHQARAAMRAKIGKALAEQLLQVYETEKAPEPYSPDAASAGKRALRNSALSLMAAGGGRTALSLVAEHYKNATNMTDQLGAFGILSLFDTPASRDTFKAFYKQWQNEPLVLDKWFALQAQSPLPQTLDRVAELVAHPLFTMENPNRVRSVYSVFAYGNPARFNDASGRGYSFVADAVIAIDGFNPQIAARLAGAFESWRMYEPGRQGLARAALDKIAAKPGLSRDCYEIVSKMLS